MAPGRALLEPPMSAFFQSEPSSPRPSRISSPCTACKRRRHPVVPPAIHPSFALQHFPYRLAGLQQTRSPPPVHNNEENVLTLTDAALCCVDR